MRFWKLRNTNAQNATLTLTAENITIGAYSTTTNTANVDITTKELLKN